jgi:putative nucleotidyltransferase with HDIG domain
VIESSCEEMRVRAIEVTSKLAQWHQWTAEHSLRVMRHAVGLAAAAGIDAELVDEIGLASLLHDIGKLSIPLEVLNKPATLSPGEWSLVRAHPQLGAEVAERLGCSPRVVAMIGAHHEHFDGSGYPFNLDGSAIPIGARIICIADIFDALTTPRSYRGALPNAQAIDLMRVQSMYFDPDLFDVFRAHIAAETAMPALRVSA